MVDVTNVRLFLALRFPRSRAWPVVVKCHRWPAGDDTVCPSGAARRIAYQSRGGDLARCRCVLLGGKGLIRAFYTDYCLNLMDGFGFVTALRGNSTSARHRRYSIIHLADLAFPLTRQPAADPSGPA